MEVKNRLVDLLQRVQEDERSFVASLGESERSMIGTPERWSAKDVVAHLAEWRARTAANLAAVRRGEPVASNDDIDASNAEIFQRYHDWSWEDVLRQSETSHSQLIERVQGLTEDELADTQLLPWQRGRPVWRAIAGNEYAHPISHLAICYAERGDQDRATALQETAAWLLAPLDDSPGWQGTIRYNLACHYALIGEKDQAITKLTEALRLYPGLAEWARQDTDLISIREEPAFQKLTETVGPGSLG
jgi:tetratricopeptide (TPR) repeat protein